MPVTGMDRMPGAGLARGTLFDKELNVTEIDVPDLTVRSSLILEKTGDFQYNLIWTSPSGDNRNLSIPQLGANDVFTFTGATQTLTSKTLTSPTINGGTATGLTDLDLAVGARTIFDTVGANTLTMGAAGTTVAIPGNLTVSGTTTTLNTTTLDVADNIFLLNSDASGSATADTGLIIERGNDTNVAMVWDESADQFIFATTNSTGGSGVTDISPIAYANLQIQNLAVAQIDAFTLSGKLTAGSSEIEGSGFDIDGGDISAVTISGGLTWSSAQDLNSQALTNANIDSGDIATAVVINKSPDITLTGDVAGSGTLSNLGNVSFATTIQANSVALGTDTTGNYVATIAGTSNEITVSGSGSENAGVTIGLPDDVTIAGDLTVSGTMTTVNTATMNVADKLIELATGTTGTPSGDSGIIIERGSAANAIIAWDESADKFVLGTTSATGSSSGDLTITSGTVVAATFEGALSGNATTATALATARSIGGVNFDGSANIVPNTITVADTTNTSASVALFESATGDLAPKTDSGLTYNAGTGMLTATGFTGPLTGNASGSAATVTSNTQAAITTLANVTTVGTLNAGSITSGFGTINIGSSALTVGAANIGGDITTSSAIDWDLVDNNASALSFDAAGKAGILAIVTTDGAEKVTMSGNLEITGDFTVNGTTTTVNSSTVTVDDPMFALADNNSADAVDIGWYGKYVDSGTKYSGIFRDASDADKWKVFSSTGNSHAAPTTTVDTSTGFALGTFVAANLEGTLTTAAQANVTSLGTLTALQVDNLNVNLNTISATTGAINITPAAGSAIVLDGTINVDAGVVTGATSITSTAFVGTTLSVSGNTTLSGDLTLDGDSDNIVMQKSYIEFQEDPSEPGYLSDHVRIFATDIHGLGIVTEEHTTANKYTSIGADHLEFDVASTISTNAGDIRIEAAGNNVVVKGTGSAASFLDVESVSGQNARLRFFNGTTAKWNIGNDVGASNNFTIYNQAASANSIQITAANALTLGGATTVSGNLSVTGDTTVGDGKWVGLSNTNNIQFGSSGLVHLNASGQQMTFNIDTDDDSTTSAFKWYKDGVDGGGTAIMGLLESGFLGVGTAAPSHPLHVTGLSQAGSTSIGYFAGDIDNNAYLMIENTDNDSSGAHAVLYAKQGNANAGDAKVVFEAPGVTWSIGADNSDSDILKIAQNASLETTTRMTIDGSGNVGLGVAPKAALHIAASGDGHAFGGKDITLSDAFGSSAQLTINLADHQGCYVKIFITGNWATGSHSAVAYLGEFFIQNGANSGSTNEPGAIIRQIDNTYNGSISAQIVDPTNDDFVIQFRTSAAEGNETAYLNFQIMGQFDSVG